MSCQILIIDVLTVFLEDDNSNLQLCSKLILLILQLDSILNSYFTFRYLFQRITKSKHELYFDKHRQRIGQYKRGKILTFRPTLRILQIRYRLFFLCNFVCILINQFCQHFTTCSIRT